MSDLYHHKAHTAPHPSQIPLPGFYSQALKQHNKKNGKKTKVIVPVAPKLLTKAKAITEQVVTSTKPHPSTPAKILKKPTQNNNMVNNNNVQPQPSVTQTPSKPIIATVVSPRPDETPIDLDLLMSLGIGDCSNDSTTTTTTTTITTQSCNDSTKTTTPTTAPATTTTTAPTTAPTTATTTPAPTTTTTAAITTNTPSKQYTQVTPIAPANDPNSFLYEGPSQGNHADELEALLSEF